MISTWKAGSWMNCRTGDRKQAKVMRARMSEAQRRRLYVLPYGKAFNTDEAFRRYIKDLQRREKEAKATQLAKADTQTDRRHGHAHEGAVCAGDENQAASSSTTGGTLDGDVSGSESDGVYMFSDSDITCNDDGGGDDASRSLVGNIAHRSDGG